MTLVKSALKPRSINLPAHPHQTRWSSPKEPASGRSPSKDKKHRARPA